MKTGLSVKRLPPKWGIDGDAPKGLGSVGALHRARKGNETAARDLEQPILLADGGGYRSGVRGRQVRGRYAGGPKAGRCRAVSSVSSSHNRGRLIASLEVRLILTGYLALTE